tara:strand:+ start:901 stop:1830 length:930 start_codon:yes stop_codon:yes gene_type:complete
MKFSLTLIFAFLMIFLSSCSITSNTSNTQEVLSLNIETTDKNKEIIIESLLQNETIFNVDFHNENSYSLGNDILNSNLKYFCKSFLDDQKDILEKSIFKDNEFINKKVLIVYTEEFIDTVNKLKEKYPNEEYFLLKNGDFEIQIKKILNIDLSISRYLDFSKLDKNIQISYSPRIRNDISSIYFLMNYSVSKTVVPIFRSYAFNIKFFSSSEIFHSALDFKKLIDFEGTYIPLTDKIIEKLSKKEDLSMKENIEIFLINDLLTIEKIYQKNLFKENFTPDSGNLVISRSNCIKRNLDLWRVSADDFNQL